VIKVEKLLTEVKIFKRCGAPRPDFERILVIGDGNALLRRQYRRIATGGLVSLSTVAGRHTLIGELRSFAAVSSGLVVVILLHVSILIIPCWILDGL
jgi:hypothetical protein